MTAALALWPSQIPVIKLIREAFTPIPETPDDPPGLGHERVIFQAPTGFGKTTIFTYIAHHAYLMGSRTHIFVHRDELITQVCARLEKYGIDHGVIAAGHAEKPWELIHVCSVQSYIKRLGRLEKPDFMIFDEAHHCTAATYVKIMDWGMCDVLGVTATPYSLQGKGLADAGFTHMVCGPQIPDLIPEYLVKPYVYTVPGAIDLGKLKMRAGEYAVEAAEQWVEDARITGDAPQQYLKLTPGTTAVAFCVSVAKAKECAEAFNAVGVPAACIDGEMAKGDRRELIRKFSTGEILVLTNCNLVSEGFDLPRIQTVILLKPSKSLVYYQQAIGRAMRKDEGKTHCTVLDHVKAVQEFGLPDSRREWSLCGRPVTEASDIKQCMQCYRWCEKAASKCPGCGASFAIGGSANKRPEVSQADGQLLFVENADLILKKKAAAELSLAIGRARNYEDFLKIAKARDYADAAGWARLAWKRRKAQIAARGKKR